MQEIQDFTEYGIWFCDKFVPNGEKSIEIPRSGILIYRNVYAIIAVGKRDSKSIQTKKSESLSTANTGGFLLPI